MSDTIHIAASGLQAESQYIQNIANDIANINTPHYKATRVRFETMLSPAAPHTATQNLGVAITKTTHDFSKGALKPTQNWHDVAIDGRGFFQIIQEDGQIAYTRNASFIIDSEHFLATPDGLRLADNIQIPESFLEITIQKNGEVLATTPDSDTPQSLGTIQLAHFMNPEGLDSTQADRYIETADSGEALLDNPGENGVGVLMQNHIESANVDMVSTLMELTLAQRVYQLNAKAVQIADELEKMTYELRN